MSVKAMANTCQVKMHCGKTGVCVHPAGEDRNRCAQSVPCWSVPPYASTVVRKSGCEWMRDQLALQQPASVGMYAILWMRCAARDRRPRPARVPAARPLCTASMTAPSGGLVPRPPRVPASP